MWETANKYLIMGLISFETLFETILLTIFFILSKGWGIVRFYVLREEATHVTIALGVVYLHYSAFFVTIELPTLNKIVRVSAYSYNYIVFIISSICLATLYCDQAFEIKFEIIWPTLEVLDPRTDSFPWHCH